MGYLKLGDLPEFKWADTVGSHLKTAPVCSFHALRYSKYGDRYQAAIVYRFTRRFNLCGRLARLIVDVVRAKPIKEQGVKALAASCSQELGPPPRLGRFSGRPIPLR